MEEIIIDGVDVSKCKHNDIDNGYCDKSYLGEGGKLKNTKNPRPCTYYPNCYYKQLKRKEKECEELKKQHYETLKMLKHECDGRQRDNEQWFTRCTENHLKDTKQIDKLKQALQEIKKTIEKFSFHFVDFEDELIKTELILQKISEVENE